jgi:hypothetical protein
MTDDPLMPELPRLPLRPEFRERVRMESTRRLRRPAWRRRAAGLMLAASLMIASLSAWWFMSRPTEPVAVAIVVGPNASPKVTPEREAALKVAAAVDMEWQAFDNRTPERPKLYLAAGDRYVQEQDYDAALRCYRESLDAGGPAVEVSPTDNWLVMALKLDRNKEN